MGVIVREVQRQQRISIKLKRNSVWTSEDDKSLRWPAQGRILCEVHFVSWCTYPLDIFRQVVIWMPYCVWSFPAIWESIWLSVTASSLGTFSWSIWAPEALETKEEGLNLLGNQLEGKERLVVSCSSPKGLDREGTAPLNCLTGGPIGRPCMSVSSQTKRTQRPKGNNKKEFSGLGIGRGNWSLN